MLNMARIWDAIRCRLSLAVKERAHVEALIGLRVEYRVM